MSAALVEEFLTHIEKEKQQSPHTVSAYRRDLEAFVAFLNRYYGGQWSWQSVDRLGIRGFLGEMERHGLAKRSTARALSAVRTFYKFLAIHHGVLTSVAKAARSPRLPKRRRNPVRRDYPWSYCHSPTSVVTGTRIISSTGSPKALRPTFRGYEAPS